MYLEPEHCFGIIDYLYNNGTSKATPCTQIVPNHQLCEVIIKTLAQKLIKQMKLERP